MKILLIDDDLSIKSRFDDAIVLWNGKHGNEESFQLECISDFEEAKKVLTQNDLSRYDGLIIDLIFKSETRGRELIDAVNARLIRVPTVVHTATSDSVDGLCVAVFKKSESKTDNILEWFHLVRKSGVMAVVGLQGSIEKELKDIFDRFQQYGLKKWAQLGIDKGEDIARRSATRYVLMHLLDALDRDSEKVFLHEMYLRVGMNDPLATGDIIRAIDGLYYIVMSPACDLEMRNCGVANSGMALLAQVATVELAVRDKVAQRVAEITKKEQGQGREITDAHRKEIADQQQKKACNEFMFGNGKCPKLNEYLHAMPPIEGEECRYVVFRDVRSVPLSTIESQFVKTGLRVSPPFLKNIQSRFVSYYGRQGQPEIDFS